jgi:hypothetical protein
MDSLFPNIKGALRGELVREQGAVPGQEQDPLDAMDPQARINYMNEKKKLDDHEAKLRLEIDKIKKSKEDLEKKYNLTQKEKQVTPWSKTGIKNTI